MDKQVLLQISTIKNQINGATFINEVKERRDRAFMNFLADEDSEKVYKGQLRELTFILDLLENTAEKLENLEKYEENYTIGKAF